MMPEGDTISCSRPIQAPRASTRNNAAASQARCRRARGSMRRPNGVSATWPETKYNPSTPTAARSTSPNNIPRSSSSAGSVNTYIDASWPRIGSALPNATWFHHVSSVIHWLATKDAIRKEAMAARIMTSGRT